MQMSGTLEPSPMNSLDEDEWRNVSFDKRLRAPMKSALFHWKHRAAAVNVIP